MKKFVFILAFLLTLFSASAEDITGSWKGTLNVQGTKLHLVFNIEKNDNGYSGTMDSPDQGANGIPLSSVTFENNVVTIKLKQAGIEYKGSPDGTGNIAGEFSQAGLTAKLILSKNAEKTEPALKPQEPVKPYPYNSEEVFFENKKDGIKMAGTFTYPSKKGKYPVVVLISGSGPQDRNEALMGHKPFLVLADKLTRTGIAVLRFDDRGVGKSEGNFGAATTVDFSYDAEAAIQYLKTRKEVKTSRMGLIGHSEGGLIAPITALRNKDVAFIVMLAGPGLSGREIVLMQQELIGRASGMPESEIKKNQDTNKYIFDLMKTETDQTFLAQKIENYMRKQLRGNADSAKMSEALPLQIAQLTSPWMQYFLNYDPAPALSKLKTPVLALIGSKDLQVPAKENLAAIETALKKAGNKKYVLKELEGLNHLFQECKTGSPMEYGQIEQTMSPQVPEIIAEWIKKL